MDYNRFISQNSNNILSGKYNNILYGEEGRLYHDKISQKIKRKQDIEEKLLKEYNEKSINFAEKSQNEWEYDEIYTVYSNLKDIRGTKLTKSSVYRTAIQLQRTIGAINWCIFHLFSERMDLHRSQTMIYFRNQFGLNTEIKLLEEK